MDELVWYERHLVGFENRLKDRDRIKDKVAESLAVKGRTVAEAMRLIPDAIRYTFCYHEADYSRHLQEDIALTRERFSDLVRLRNFWHSDQYKGISSLGVTGGRRDEAFTQAPVWRRSSLLVSAERSDLENDFIEITAAEARRIVDRIRQAGTSNSPHFL